MLKYTLQIIFIFLASLLNAQVTHQVRVSTGLSAGLQDQIYLRTECTITEGYVILQSSYQTNGDDHILQLKGGFGLVRPNWRFYTYLPYLNFKYGEGYNTPFCFEVFYKHNFSLNIDIYKDYVIPSLRANVAIYKNKPIAYHHKR
jgi:hypothetical protein